MMSTRRQRKVNNTVEDLMAVNLRRLEGVEWGDIVTCKHDGREEPMYIVPE
jgi:hypothetical protein